MKKVGKFVAVGVLIAIVSSFFALGLHDYLSIEQFQSHRERIEEYFFENRFLSILIYSLIYIAVTGLSLPGASVLTLVGGALFGLLPSIVIVSIASTTGATLAFLLARYLFYDAVQSKFGDRLQKINERLADEGAFYLFSLRLIPAFPFFVINLVMGLTSMRTWTFAFVSQLGMLPGTIVYVNAGTQLGQLDSLQGVFSANILLSFALIGIFPILAKKIIELFRNRPERDL